MVAFFEQQRLLPQVAAQFRVCVERRCGLEDADLRHRQHERPRRIGHQRRDGASDVERFAVQVLSGHEAPVEVTVQAVATAAGGRVVELVAAHLVDNGHRRDLIFEHAERGAEALRRVTAGQAHVRVEQVAAGDATVQQELPAGDGRLAQGGVVDPVDTPELAEQRAPEQGFALPRGVQRVGLQRVQPPHDGGRAVSAQGEHVQQHRMQGRHFEPLGFVVHKARSSFLSSGQAGLGGGKRSALLSPSDRYISRR